MERHPETGRTPQSLYWLIHDRDYFGEKSWAGYLNKFHDISPELLKPTGYRGGKLITGKSFDMTKLKDRDIVKLVQQLIRQARQWKKKLRIVPPWTKRGKGFFWK